MQASLKPEKLLVTKSTSLHALPPAAAIMLLTLPPQVPEILPPTSRTSRARSCISGSCPQRTSASSSSLKTDHLKHMPSRRAVHKNLGKPDQRGSRGSGPMPELSYLSAALRMADASLEARVRAAAERHAQGPLTDRTPNRCRARSKSLVCQREELRAAAALRCCHCTKALSSMPTRSKQQKPFKPIEHFLCETSARLKGQVIRRERRHL